MVTLSNIMLSDLLAESTLSARHDPSVGSNVCHVQVSRAAARVAGTEPY